MEMVETEKDHPKEGPHTKPLFEHKTTKTAAPCMGLTSNHANFG